MTEVIVLRYWHKHGEDLSAYATQEAAEASMAAVARQGWDEIADEAGVPSNPDNLTDEAARKMYFDRMGDTEGYDTTSLTVQS